MDRNAFFSLCASHPGWVVQPKYDGWFCRVTPEGTFGRNGTRLSNANSRQGIEYHGEMLIKTTWGNAHPEHGRIIVFWCNKGMGYRLPWFFPGRWVETYTQAYALKYYEALMSAYEGIVLKDPLSGEFVKHKNVVTQDYVITGFTLTTSLVHPMIGALEISAYQNGTLRRIGTVSQGLTLDDKYLIFQRPADYRGRVIEVEGACLYDSGALRSPVFVRFRDDKPACECQAA